MAHAELLCPHCEADGARWGAMEVVALACPHGYVAPTEGPLSPPLQCKDTACREAASAAQAKAQLVHDSYPAKADPVRWKAEIDSRAPTAALLFKEACARPFQAVAMHEHTGAFRDAWAARGVRAASISNRPSMRPPRQGTLHFIAEVQEWHAAYPWAIPLATANPDCH